MTVNLGKVLVALALVASVTVLMATGSISAEAGLPTLSALTFYVLGNGVTTLKGKQSEPLVGPSDARNVDTPPQSPLHVTAPAVVLVEHPPAPMVPAPTPPPEVAG